MPSQVPTGALQIADIVVHIDLLGDPVRHFGCQALAADVALERRAHLDDVEVDRAGRDRLLQAGVVVGLRKVDPGDLGAGIFLPRLQQAAEQHVVQVLVVEAHEAQLDAGELAFLDVRLGRIEAERADLLPIGIGRLAGADARDLAGSGRAGSSCAAAGRVSAPSVPVDAAASAAMLAAPLRTSRRVAPARTNCS